MEDADQAAGPPAPSGLAGVVATARQAPGSGLPPVHLWNPPHCGDIDIRIGRDGTWRHEGAPIGRPALVRLFSTVLRLDPDGYCLVTPVEKLRIQVEDAPFLAVRVDRRGDDLVFQTNVGDEVVAGPGHRLEVAQGVRPGEPAPYLHVRRGLKARLTRPVYYELVDMAEPTGPDGVFTVQSGGERFLIGGMQAA